MSNTHNIESRGIRLAACLTLLACGSFGCSTDPHDPDASNGRKGDMQAHFEATGSLETSCGTAAGVRIAAEGPGEASAGCDAEWFSYDDGNGTEHIADCFFVVEPGVWSFTELAAIDENGDALSCCTSSPPDDVTVASSETTEVGGSIACDVDQNGGLDVFVTIERPPVIVDVDITPSKFGTTCEAIGLEVEATDSDGGPLTYEWTVITAPTGASWSLEASAEVAAFASQNTGDYEVRVKAINEAGLSSQLDFPLHIVAQGDSSCDTRAVCLLFLDLEL